MTITKKYYLIASYALFLAWLLSFLYNGPAIDILFAGPDIHKGFLAISYILAPAVFLLIMGTLNISRENKRIFIRTGILICLLGTAVILVIGDLASPYMSYLFAAVMGMFSVVFITGWGCYFVELLDMDQMWLHMGLVICIGNVIYNINGILKTASYHRMIVVILFLSLIGAAFASESMIRRSVPLVKDFGIPLQSRTLILMAVFVFLLNLGGGIVHTMIGPMTRVVFPHMYAVDLLIYGILGLVIFLMGKKLETEITLSISLVLIATGYISIILFSSNPIVGYVLTMIGYAVVDVMIWTTVGEMGYIFGRPVRIFAIVMSANLFAVFGGNLMGVVLSGTNDYLYVAIGFTAISIVMAFAFLPQLVRSSEQYISMMEKVIIDREAAKGVVTNEKAKHLLTPRELTVFQLMITNMKNQTIADQLGISSNTLKEHARHIYSKMGVNNKRELIAELNRSPAYRIEAMSTIRDNRAFAELTNREVEVCYLLGTGMTMAEISDKLSISQNTTKTHISRIYSKLSVSGKKDLLRFMEEVV